MKFPLVPRSKPEVDVVTDPLTPPNGSRVTVFIFAEGLKVVPSCETPVPVTV